VRPFLALFLAISSFGCSDDEPVTFKSRLPFDAVVEDGNAAVTYGLRVTGEQRDTLCTACTALAKSPAGDHALVTTSDATTGATSFFIVEPGRVNEVLNLAAAATDGAPAELPALLQAVWSPDSSRLALLWGTTQAYLAAGDGTGLVPVATGGFNAAGYADQNISWSQDGSHVAFTFADGVLAITDAAGSSTLTLPAGSTGHQWSPDGSLFAFTNAGVSLVSTATLETRLVSSTATQSIGWSQDGAWFTYQDGGLVLAPADDSDPVVVPLDAVASAVWSPVANELIYGGYNNRDAAGVDVELGLWSPDRSLAVPVNSEVVNRVPQALAWSPDGTRFMYRLPDSTGMAYAALVAASDGSELARFPAFYDGLPTFNRDGTLLAVTSTKVGTGASDTALSVSNAAGSDAVPIASSVDGWRWLDDGEHLLIVTERSVAIARDDGSQVSTRLNVGDGTHVALVP